MNLAANLDPVMVMRRRALRKARGRRRLMLVGGAIALIVLVVGYYGIRSSPVFDVREVAVTGGDPALNAAIQAKTETATEGRSLLAVDSGSIQRAVEALPAVRSATVDRSFPNELSVSIVMYHPAVAVTSGHHTYLVADDAHVIGTVKAAPPHVVAVALPDGAKLAVGQTSTDRNLAAALWLLRSTPTWFSHQFGRITDVTPRAGTVTATVGSHMQLRLGSPNQLDLKMKVVTRSLGRLDARDRKTIKYVDVSAPGRPVYRVRS
jgi:cell division protein FtsQ